jgi:hypothetical protein
VSIRVIRGKNIPWQRISRISVHWQFHQVALTDVQITRFTETDQETALENGQGKETRQAREEAGALRLNGLFCGRGALTPQ